MRAAVRYHRRPCIATRRRTAEHQSPITECRAERRLCVRIVHGKGHRSDFGPVLKRMVDRLLRQLDDVLAFCSARQMDGGTGAVMVLLKRPA